MKTLLERAKEYATPQATPPRPVTNDEIDLFIALLVGDISLVQAYKAMGVPNNALYARLFVVIKHLVETGQIEFDVKRDKQE